MKQAVQLAALSAANIGIAFLFQWYILIEVGPGAETDALFAGMTIPQLVLVVISGSLMHVLVPLLSGESKDRLRHDAWAFVALIGGTFGLLAVLLFVAAPWWVPLTVPGFDDAGKAFTVELTRIQLISMVFSAINGVQWAAYHARQQFVWAEFTPIIASAFALILLIWALPRYGVIAAAWIGTLRAGLQTLLLAPGMGYPVRPDLKSAAIQEAWKRIKPLLLGTAYYKTDSLVDRFLLSMAAGGSLSLFHLANQIFGAATQVINKAIISPLVPALTRLHKQKNKAEFRSLYKRRMLQVGIFGVMNFLLLAFLGKALIGQLPGYGQFTADDLNLLWLIMLLMFGKFLIGNLGSAMTAVFYSVGDTKSPTVVGVVAYSLGIVVKVIMFYFMGLLGLALGVSMYYAIALLLLAAKSAEKKYV